MGVMDMSEVQRYRLNLIDNENLDMHRRGTYIQEQRHGMGAWVKWSDVKGHINRINWISVKDQLPPAQKPRHAGQSYFESDTVLVWVEKANDFAKGKFIFDKDGRWVSTSITGYGGDWEVSHYAPINTPEGT